MMEENLNLFSSIEITNECLSLISSIIGSNEYSEFSKITHR